MDLHPAIMPPSASAANAKPAHLGLVADFLCREREDAALCQFQRLLRRGSFESSRSAFGQPKPAAGDGSRDAFFVCGQIADSYSGAMGLFELFQAPMVEAFPSNGVVQHSFELMLAEVAGPSLGTQAVTEVLMKQCLIILLRQHLAASDFASPLLAALRNPKLARAVIAVLEQPSAPHSVDSLAASVKITGQRLRTRWHAAS